MAFVYRSPKLSYFDQTAISSLKNDVTNLSSFLGQDESEIYNQGCIREASTNQPNIKNHAKGLTFISKGNINSDLSNIVLGNRECDRLVSVYQQSRASSQSKKIHKLPHAFNSKDPSLQKNMLAQQVKQFLQNQRLRKIEQLNSRSYSRNKVVIKSKEKQIQKPNQIQMKSFKNQKIRQTAKKSIHCSVNQQNGKIPKLINRNIRKVLAQQSQIGKVPSIPSKRNQYGYILCDSNQSLTLPKLVSQMKYTGDKQNMPGPCDYDYKIKSKVKGVPKIEKIKKSVHKIKETEQIKSCLRSQESTAPEKVKKVSKIPRTQNEINQLKKTQQINQNYSDSDSDTEYEENATPGPGQYNLQTLCRKQFRSKKQQLQNIFYSKQVRFLKNQVNYHQITTVKQANNSPKMKDQSFLSRAQRKLTQDNRGEFPSPGDYDDRNSLEHKVVSRILKSSSSKAFISNDKRFHQYSNPLMPGPGQYDHESTQKLNQEKDRLTSCFKSTLERNIFKTKKQKANFKPVKQPIIHNIKDCILQEQQPQKPGFSSSSPRFKQNKQLYESNYTSNIFDERVVKPSPKKYPFNSSQSKRGIETVGQGVGVGSYETLEENKWSKKSYNILYN